MSGPAGNAPAKPPEQRAGSSEDDELPEELITTAQSPLPRRAQRAVHTVLLS